MDVEDSGDNNNDDQDMVCSNGAEGEDNSITHTFDFFGTGEKFIKIRELPITRADNPFGSETNPEVSNQRRKILLQMNHFIAIFIFIHMIVHQRQLYSDICFFLFFVARMTRLV